MRTFFALALLVPLIGFASPNGDVVVAADGSGNYTSLQEAISAAPMRPANSPWVILVRPGTYRERIYVQRERGNIHVLGEDAATTIVTYNLHANLPGPDGKPIGTFRTPTVQIDGDGMIWENLTLENSAGPVGQALALRADGDRLTFRRCRFLGWQDTILVNRGRHYFEDCYIEGHVDFIFGGATAYFSGCHIHALKDGYLTAASTPRDQAHGFVFADCKITGADGAKTFLGRPWRNFAKTIFLRTEMSGVVRPEGWHNWNKPEAEKTTFYAEAENTGPGAAPDRRVKWAHALAAKELSQYSAAEVLKGDDGWNPLRRGSGGAPVAPWVADLGDGRYQNPILHADYSDPDVVRVGDDYWMTSSSFGHAPGLPILHSRDLVNWTLVGHALPRQIPDDVFSVPQHGKGVWAPAIRHHAGKFWIYYPDPDFGIYVLTASDPRGPWSEPTLVKGGKGLIDPCPLWDEDGKVYPIHAWAKSRSGINNVLTLLRLNAAGTAVEEDLGVIIDGHKIPGYSTLEGPKFLKRNGWYYVFAPAGGVATGWQAVFRARDIRGPYEVRSVLAQGTTRVNGPHQGALVDTARGDWWFVHFQDKEAYGRVVHLQPAAWKDDWPLMGTGVRTGAMTGEPVLTHAKPAVPPQPVSVPPTTDDFSGERLGVQWQWQANPGRDVVSLQARAGFLRFQTQAEPKPGNLYEAPHLLMQKFPAPAFTCVAKLEFAPGADGEAAGLIVFGYDYSWIGLRRAGGRLELVHAIRREAVKGEPQELTVLEAVASPSVWLRVDVAEGGHCLFSTSTDGTHFKISPAPPFTATVGRWVGAKVGLFASASGPAAGFADFDRFEVLAPGHAAPPVAR